MQYPFSEQPQYLLPRTISQKLQSWLDARRVTRRRRRTQEAVSISPLREVPPVRPTALVAICLSRNDMDLLRFFLAHYRRLGVSRFAFLDDGSTDGTRDFLLSQPDVDVWTSPVRYRDARRGKLWREALFRAYGTDRWYLNLDSDEFLIYDQYNNFTLFDVIETLTDLGIKRLPAPMLDMYPSDKEEEKTGNHPWEASRFLDKLGYKVNFTKRAISISGGPRGRKFGEKNELMKYPLTYWDESCSLGVSIHQPLPYNWNFSGIWGALLHFKFHGDIKRKVASAIADRQHFNAAEHYGEIAKFLEANEDLGMMGPDSVAYVNDMQLRDLGLISKIPYD